MSCHSDIYFWRQVLVALGDCLHSFGIGFMLSFSSVLNPAILSPNSTDIRVSAEDASWISASLGFAGTVGYCFIPFIFQSYGRKTVLIGLNISVVVGFLIFYFAKSATALFVGKFFQGIATCGVTITVIIMAEYSDPKRRGYFTTIKKCTVALGSLICHSLYFTWTWRQISLLACLPFCLSTIDILFWPESPDFLAMKGRYNECSESHSWLFGDSTKASKNLNDLISAQVRRKDKKKKNAMEIVMRILGKFVRKDFMMPFIIVTLLTVIIEASGRYYMMTYIIQIVLEITGDRTLAVYCSIGADIFTIIALLISTFVIRLMSRRNILFYFGYTTVALMYIISIIMFLKSRYSIGSDMPWLTPSVILLNTLVSYIGVTPTCFTIFGEIFPLEHKGTGTFATGIVFTSLYAVTLKYIPIIMEKLGVEGLFAIFATCLLISFIFLHFILIETKDKTLQEIEDEVKGNVTTETLLSQKPNEEI
ncbi:unnamed protein product [Colias eurytheme]|nr:unnamed protein product [Colias eurytheme]